MVQSEHEFREFKAMRLNRLNDRLFKYIFASEQHRENLIRFLNDVPDDPDRVIADIEYLDRECDPWVVNSCWRTAG